MRSFVSILKMYEDSSSRDVENLSKVYRDRELQYRSIKELVLQNMGVENIRDKKILLKPNLVRECLKDQDEVCLFTHPNLIIETVKIMLENGASSIVVGDAPIQGCDWNKLIPEYLKEELCSLSQQFKKPVKLIDFRKVIYDSTTHTAKRSQRKDEDYLVFDTGEKSWLEPITTPKNKFRVTCYDPRRMAMSHEKGKHQYCVAKEVFECDTIITMPKMKTHRMAGFTNSLKILVGMNGDKDYLPHHRIGSTSCGGDCYKGFSLFRTLSEHLADFSNMYQGKWFTRYTRIAGSLLWKFSNPTPSQLPNAGWYGNDTVWRMVLDLNIIAEYGTIKGKLAEKPQRTLWTLCDGIVGGQGDGPLHPDPFPLGVLCFSNNPYLMDVIGGQLFGMNIDKIPLLREAKSRCEDEVDVLFVNGKPALINEINDMSRRAIMSPGWMEYDK